MDYRFGADIAAPADPLKLHAPAHLQRHNPRSVHGHEIGKFWGKGNVL